MSGGIHSFYQNIMTQNKKLLLLYLDKHYRILFVNLLHIDFRLPVCHCLKCITAENLKIKSMRMYFFVKQANDTNCISHCIYIARARVVIRKCCVITDTYDDGKWCKHKVDDKLLRLVEFHCKIESNMKGISQNFEIISYSQTSFIKKRLQFM